MKKYYLLIIFTLCYSTTKAQNTNLEKSIFGVQTGVLGIWVHNEARLAPKTALRSEVGFNAVFLIGEGGAEDGFIMAPTLALEPRYYYNIEKRHTKGKSIHHNAANFLSLDILYVPDWFVISSVDADFNTLESINFIPKWGIRRNIGKNFTYELGLGVGYQYAYTKKLGSIKNTHDVVVDLDIRIGYTF